MLTTSFTTAAVHLSGPLQPIVSTAMYENNWYTSHFLPRMITFYKGPLVWAPHDIASQAQGAGRMWAIYENKVYDLTDYFNTVRFFCSTSSETLELNCSGDNVQITAMPGYTGYSFLDSNLSNLWQQQPGQDITSAVKALKMDSTTFNTNMACITNLFYVGETDFRLTPKCQVQPYLLLSFSILLVATILAKFLAALQLGSKRSPEMRDKFVICTSPLFRLAFEARDDY